LRSSAIRATIRVFGNVQAVGYRVLAKIIVRKMGVKGLIRDLEDGSVEVFVEAEEKVVDEFVKAIDIKGRPEDMLSLHVDRIEAYREGEPGYRGPWKS